jgi:FkbM family methyltransferase
MVYKALQSLATARWNSLKNKYVGPRAKAARYTRFHSQFGEDRYIYEHIDLPAHGVFVDVGAGHPVYLSNTYFFERNGWTGVCIDADPQQYDALRKERRHVEWAAVSAADGEIELSQAYWPTYSTTIRKDQYKGLAKATFKQTIRVPTCTLETILTKYQIGAIDILDIDVEGTELDVWNTFDYEQHKPRVIIIEYYTFGLADNAPAIKTFFSALPYTLVHATCTNLIFRHINS